MKTLILSSEFYRQAGLSQNDQWPSEICQEDCSQKG